MNGAATAAAAYLELGLAVIQLRPRSKAPATAHGKKDASRDPQQVAAWFPPNTEHNIGILTGERSLLLVLDVDPRNGGDASFERLVRDHGGLPVTKRAITGGGGFHLFFRLPEGSIGLKDRPNVAGYPGVDVKCDGYVVAPPSIHPDTGKAYAWDGDAPMAFAPDWLIDLARGGKHTKPAGSLARSSVAEGSRNTRLCSRAGSYRARGWSEEAIREALLAENEEWCDPPLDTAEIERIARSVAQYAPGSRHPDTDLGNARRLVDALSGSVRYDHACRAWFLYQEGCWQRDNSGAILRAAKAVADKLLADAQAINDPDHRRRHIAFATKSQSQPRLKAMVELAESEPGISVRSADFDKASYLLNVQNGTVDLRTGILQPHNRDDLLSRKIEIPFDAAAACPTLT